MAIKRFRKGRKPMRKRMPQRGGTTSVATLARQVRQLQKKTALVTQDITYRVAETVDSLTGVVTPYIMRNLSNFSNWTTLFPSGMDVQKNEMYYKKFTIDNLITLDGPLQEYSTVNFTYMVISARKEAGTQTVNGFSSSVLVNGDDYTSISGKAYMNLRKWRVHYIKRFTLTSLDTAIIQTDQCQRRFSHTVKVNRKVVNPDGSWISLVNSPDPTDTFYVVLFNDNSSADGQSPSWQFNAIMTVNE